MLHTLLQLSLGTLHMLPHVRLLVSCEGDLCESNGWSILPQREVRDDLHLGLCKEAVATQYSLQYVAWNRIETGNTRIAFSYLIVLSIIDPCAIKIYKACEMESNDGDHPFLCINPTGLGWHDFFTRPLQVYKAVRSGTLQEFSRPANVAQDETCPHQINALPSNILQPKRTPRSFILCPTPLLEEQR